MTKRAESTERTQAENGAGRELVDLVEPMLAGMTVTRHHLLAWVHAQGLAALDELFRDEAMVPPGTVDQRTPFGTLESTISRADQARVGSRGEHRRGFALLASPW